ncbi:LysR family transcriptional regulator [Catenovulum sp. 2E275]|uniref:LysR family transcriptional regulator n=1 Tax=Catenovulum sp. 2E275 TaxID=2980497 RepID=UPI0021D3B522|nr:LysR family transcriptional regulator [Catenovulum sp. 2E275]MCU4676524.1 LysR family transcriptional regulator [Catenovulum sp. 2E275]
MINPLWLKTFRKVCEIKSFTKAAEQLNITQAAVSQHIRHLEKNFGELLLRQSRKIELTPRGSILLEYCMELIQVNNKLNVRMSESSEISGAITFSCPGSIGLRLYPLMLNFQQNNPTIQIHNRFAPDQDVLEKVLTNQVDFGLTGTKPDDPKIKSEAFCKEELELIVPANFQGNDWPSLSELGFIDHPDGKAMLSRLCSRLCSESYSLSELPVSGFSNQISLILEPVARGFGFTVLPRYAREAFNDQTKIKVLNQDRAVVDTIWLIYRSEWPLQSKAKIAIEYLRESLNQK